MNTEAVTQQIVDALRVPWAAPAHPGTSRT